MYRLEEKKSEPFESQATVILFWVRVPVLSEHRTVAEPRVSMAAGFLVRTFRFDMRQAPSARKTVRTTGNSSGSMAMARVIPARKPFSRSPRERVYTTITSRHRADSDDSQFLDKSAHLSFEFGFLFGY